MQFEVPVYAQVELIVVGGATGGVAAAAAAARKGRKVFLGAAEPYLGEDICATGRLWLKPKVPLDTELARALYTGPDGERLSFLKPASVKQTLNEALMEADVDFRFGCTPADLLVDAAGHLAGVLFTSKCGPFAVTARRVIDATPAAHCARMAGVAFTAWPAEGTIAFSRVIIGGDGSTSDPANTQVPIHTQPLGEVTVRHNDEWLTRQAYRHLLPQTLSALTPEAVAAAEQALRNRTWHPQAHWYSERADWNMPDAILSDETYAWKSAADVPLNAFQTSFPGLTILGTCAALSRQDAANLTIAPYAIVVGKRLGQTIEEMESVNIAECQTLPSGIHDPLLHEPSTHPRPPTASSDWISHTSKTLSQFGTFDVVVVGGGTGGAPAAIAAARAGARVLLLETLHDLGGIGTLGCISIYWYGNRAGFTEEVTTAMHALSGEDPLFNARRWNPLHKSEWFRRELLKAGGQIWFGALSSGVYKKGSQLSGVIVNTPWGRGLVRAKCVIDATGNADVAASAGAACFVASENDLAIQGSGLPSRPFNPGYHNTDYTFIDDSDLLDTTRAFVVAQRRFQDTFEISPLPGTRERRQIVGDVMVKPIDVYAGRTWSDSICLSRSNFDSHGFTVDPLFFVLPPDQSSIDAWMPLRAMLPKGISGILVTGLAISGHRDVMPVLRMQADIQNHAYAAGLAAVMALSCKGEIRRIDIRKLQRSLVDIGILPQTALLHCDPAPAPRVVLSSAAKSPLSMHAELAAILTDTEASRLLLRQRFYSEEDPELRARCARLLTVIGDSTGAEVLIKQLREFQGWDEGWNYRGMGQFGRSVSPLDEIILLLAHARVRIAKDAVLEKIKQLDGDPDLSHVRAIAIYCETFPDDDFAAALEKLLSQPALSHHAWTTINDELAHIPADTRDNTTRNNSLRELYIARALWRCGDLHGLATARLSRYALDIRGHFARHARKILNEPHGRNPERPRNGATHA